MDWGRIGSFWRGRFGLGWRIIGRANRRRRVDLVLLLLRFRDVVLVVAAVVVAVVDVAVVVGGVIVPSVVLIGGKGIVCWIRILLGGLPMSSIRRWVMEGRRSG